MVLDHDRVEAATQAMLLAAGVDPMDLNILSDRRYNDQVIAFILALRKNVEREKTYNGLWRHYGLSDCASNARNKAQRVEHHASGGEVVTGIQDHDAAMDDTLDLINYGAFCARLVDASAREAGMTPS